jgi:hypothetical protein
VDAGGWVGGGWVGGTAVGATGAGLHAMSNTIAANTIETIFLVVIWLLLNLNEPDGTYHDSKDRNRALNLESYGPPFNGV